MKQPLLMRQKISLKDFDPAYCEGLDKEKTRQKTTRYCQQIGELQQLLYANAKNAVVILFQGMDASGKDGVGRRVLECVNPAGVETANFKAPSSEERAHDYLWRVHKLMPRFGNIGIFNRSHYEEVLIVRVMELQPEAVWKQRFDQINHFEKFLTDNGVLLLKFFLHLSKKEQAERFRARLEDPRKNWKFAEDDLKMRLRWDAFQQAYQDAINRCSAASAPWHIVPADHKWYRDYVVSRAVANAMESLHMDWPKPKQDLSKIKVI